MAGFLVACAALGEMLVPLATGGAMHVVSPASFVWVMLIAVALATASVAALSLAAAPLPRYQRALSRTTTQHGKRDGFEMRPLEEEAP